MGEELSVSSRTGLQRAAASTTLAVRATSLYCILFSAEHGATAAEKHASTERYEFLIRKARKCFSATENIFSVGISSSLLRNTRKGNESPSVMLGQVDDHSEKVLFEFVLSTQLNSRRWTKYLNVTDKQDHKITRCLYR